MKRRTILEAIKLVFEDKHEGMSHKQNYQEIIDRDLYEFGACYPPAMVHQELRRHCIDITNFPTNSSIKCFRIVKLKIA